MTELTSCNDASIEVLPSVVDDCHVECDHMDASDEVAPKSRWPSSYSKDEYRAFKSINRDEENDLVKQYQLTKRTDILMTLLKLRDATLKYMARRYAFLDNEDDMYSEFKGTWLKCVKQYDARANMREQRDENGAVIKDEKGIPQLVSKKTPFNTYLYTSMKHRAANLIKKRNSKKQLDGNGDPAVETMRSLDYKYGDDCDMTLKDVIPDSGASRSSSVAELSDIMHHLGVSDPDVMRAVRNYEANPSLGSLAAAGNYRVGTLAISKTDRTILKAGAKTEEFTPSASATVKASKYLTEMIQATKVVACKFEVYSFDVYHGRVDFVVKVDDPEVMKKIKDAIEKCKRLYPDFVISKKDSV